MHDIVIVSGIPGVGKTTVVMKALDLIKNEYKIVNYGNFMFEHAKEQNLVSNRDQMRKLSSDAQKNIQIKAAEEIHTLAEKNPILVDTHCSIKTPKGYLPGMPKWVLDKLKPTKIILVEAKDSEIAQRRATDSSRERDPDSEKSISEHQQINRSFSAAYSTLSAATVSIVENNDGEVERAAEILAEVLK